MATLYPVRLNPRRFAPQNSLAVTLSLDCKTSFFGVSGFWGMQDSDGGRVGKQTLRREYKRAFSGFVVVATYNVEVIVRNVYIEPQDLFLFLRNGCTVQCLNVASDFV